MSARRWRRALPSRRERRALPSRRGRRALRSRDGRAFPQRARATTRRARATTRAAGRATTRAVAHCASFGAVGVLRHADQLALSYKVLEWETSRRHEGKEVSAHLRRDCPRRRAPPAPAPLAADACFAACAPLLTWLPASRAQAAGGSGREGTSQGVQGQRARR